MAEVILTFKFDGTVKKETKGFVGTDCVDKTKFIEEALGVADKRKYTTEYYDGVKETDQDKIRT
jgi:Protein of unknown function (DUF2997)